jgi:hypothetical protein
VIAVNAGTTASDVQLTVPGLGDRSLKILGGTRTVVAQHDTFADRLGPLRVRIYIASPRTGDAQGP